jgi:hypothetical protein
VAVLAALAAVALAGGCAAERPRSGPATTAVLSTTTMRAETLVRASGGAGQGRTGMFRPPDASWEVRWRHAGPAELAGRPWSITVVPVTPGADPVVVAGPDAGERGTWEGSSVGQHYIEVSATGPWSVEVVDVGPG